MSVRFFVVSLWFFFFFKQKTAYEMRISDWSSDVCSSDLPCDLGVAGTARRREAALASSGQSRRQRLAFCSTAVGQRSGRGVALRLATAGTIFRREQSRGCAQSLRYFRS